MKAMFKTWHGRAMLLILGIFLSLGLTACETDRDAQALKVDETQKEVAEVDTLPKPKNLEQIYQAILYPREAKENNIQGKVIAKIMIDTDGTYLKHEILKSDHDLLTEAVESHLSKLLFSPAYKDGKAVRTWVSLPFSFKFKTE